MTRTFWTIAAVVAVMLAVAVGVIYRSPIQSFFASQAAEPVATTTPESTWPEYAGTTYTIEYPPGYTVNSSYAYDQFGPNKLIRGASFTVPPEMAMASTSSPQAGTNLSQDTRISVEQLPRAKNCSADIYILDNVTAQKITDGGVEYSLASTSGAAAGNRYEEVVYALVGSTPCTAVRYYVHYAAIENFPAGAVREFDRQQLLSEFDQIRKSLTLHSPQP